MLSLVEALSRADYFLVTTDRQKHFYLGAMALSGVDCREDRIAVVPIAAVADAGGVPMAEDPAFVSGGVAWPWQDSSWALERVAARLDADGRGTLHLWRGAYPLKAEGDEIPPAPVPNGPRVVVHPLLDHPEMCTLIARSWCVVDVTARNLEREMALSFRQVDALACGTPLVIGAHQPLAAWIADYDAGWVVSHGDDAGFDLVLEQVIGDAELVAAKKRRARQLAEERFAPAHALAPFVEIAREPARRHGHVTLVTALAQRSEQAGELETQLAETRHRLQDLESDIAKKDQENAELTAQVRGLMDAVGKLSTSLEAAARGQENAILVAAEREDAAGADLVALQRDLAASRRDVVKKSLELEKCLTQRDALEADVANLEELARGLRQRLEKALQDAAHWRTRHDAARRQATELRAEHYRLREELSKKEEEIQALWQTRDRLNDDIAGLASRLSAADAALAAAEARTRSRIEGLEGALDDQREATSAWKARCEQTERALAGVRSELEALKRFRGLARLVRLAGEVVDRGRSRVR